MPRAELDKEPGDVAAMFDAIAERYDLLNDVLSAGQVRLWRRAVARITGASLGERVLDLAAGTGTSALSFTAAGADCVACDFSLGMLQAGQARLRARLAGAGGPPTARDNDPDPRGNAGASRGVVPAGVTSSPPGRLSLVAGDALRLPFRDEAFDAVTISFGLRNVAVPGQALAEMRRGTRPGGRLGVW